MVRTHGNRTASNPVATYALPIGQIVPVDVCYSVTEYQITALKAALDQRQHAATGSAVRMEHGRPR